MDLGIGFGEIAMVALLVLVFFGPKEIPTMLRQLGKITAMLRKNYAEITRELQKVAEPDSAQPVDTNVIEKGKLRDQFVKIRNGMSTDDIAAKSKALAQRVFDHHEWKNASVLMIYLSLPHEVGTDAIIAEGLRLNKRMVVPYIKEGSKEFDITEITTLDDLVFGPHAIRQPKPEFIKPFLKSDLKLILCPGVAFDRNGRRIGFGKGYYDRFLKELNARVPLVGLAFDSQIIVAPGEVPFCYHDVSMNVVVTESETVGEFRRVG